MFGTTLIASRLSVGQYAPTTYVWLRLAIASLGFLAIYMVLRRRFPRDRKLWKQAALLGALGTAVPMVSIVVSLLFQSSGVTSILLTVGPAITVLMAHFFLEDESLDVRKGAGVGLALGGAFLLTLRGETGLGDGVSFNPIGYGLVFLAMICGSTATVYARKYMQGQDSIDVTTIRLMVATLLVAPISLLLIGFDMSQVDGTGYIALLYAALVGTLAAMYLAFHNIIRFGATAAAVTLYIVPIVTGLIGVLLLGEQITIGILLGMALIFVGVGLINYPKRSPEYI